MATKQKYDGATPIPNKRREHFCHQYNVTNNAKLRQQSTVDPIDEAITILGKHLFIRKLCARSNDDTRRSATATDKDFRNAKRPTNSSTTLLAVFLEHHIVLLDVIERDNINL